MGSTVFLVHGTFARGAPWMQKGSALRTALEALGPEDEVACESFSWTGANLQSHRLKAAADLHAMIDAASTRDPDRKLFVVAHSHGGSILNLMLSRFEGVNEKLAGMVFISTPFILVSRRPHMEHIRGMSEYFMYLFAPLLTIALPLGIGYLVDAKAAWVINMLSFWWLVSLYFTTHKLVNARLPDMSFRKWLLNFAAVYLGILAAVAPATLLHQFLADHAWPKLASLAVSVPAFIVFGIVVSRLLGRWGLLYDTVGKDSHIAVSIKRILKDFEQPQVPTSKALYVRFTSDEASLSLALAQGLSKLIDFCMNGFLALLSVASPGFWKAGWRRLGIAARMAWLAALAVVLVLLTNTAVHVLLGAAALLEAAVTSLIDALIHLKVPDTWNFSHSASIELSERLEPYLAWSLDLGNGRYPPSIVNVALAAPILLLTCLAALLSLSFGAAYFWSAVHVEFSVEATPAGECELITFCPQAIGGKESSPDFWDQSLMAHSLGYTDPRSIARICERIKRWMADDAQPPVASASPDESGAEGRPAPSPDAEPA